MYTPGMTVFAVDENNVKEAVVAFVSNQFLLFENNTWAKAHDCFESKTDALAEVADRLPMLIGEQEKIAQEAAYKKEALERKLKSVLFALNCVRVVWLRDFNVTLSNKTVMFCRKGENEYVTVSAQPESSTLTFGNGATANVSNADYELAESPTLGDRNEVP